MKKRAVAVFSDLKLPEKTNEEIDRMFCPDTLSFDIKGEPLTREMRIIAALVKKLGGKVKITDNELEAVKGLAEISSGDGFELIA